MLCGGAIFVDHASGYVDVQHQVTLNAADTVKAKLRYEQDAHTNGVVVQSYHTDNGVFTSQEFMEKRFAANQRIRFSGSGAAHQNGVAKTWDSDCGQHGADNDVACSHAQSRGSGDGGIVANGNGPCNMDLQPHPTTGLRTDAFRGVDTVDVYTNKRRVVKLSHVGMSHVRLGAKIAKIGSEDTKVGA